MDKPTTNDCPAWIVSCYIMTRAREVVKTNFKIIIIVNGKLRLLYLQFRYPNMPMMEII